MNFFFKKNTPRYFIFLFDIFISIISFYFSYLIRFEFSIPSIEFENLNIIILIFIIIRIIFYILFKTFSGIIRYTSIGDTLRIFISVSIGSLILFIFNLFKFYYIDNKYLIPNSIIIIEMMVTAILLIASRIIIKTIYNEFVLKTKEFIPVIIYGAGGGGEISKKIMERDNKNNYKIVAFVDDDKTKIGKLIEGVKIYEISRLEELINKNEIKVLLFSTNKIETQKRQLVIDICLDKNVIIKNIPNIKKWIEGDYNLNQIKNLKIEDLLGRKVIGADNNQIKEFIKNKNVLITGASGSIGSEISIQILKYKPQKLILLDIAETGLYELEMELRAQYIDIDFDIVIADVRQYDRMKKVFEYFNPDLVFHAAAYKHVPLMENNPSEAVMTNILGTKNVVDLSNEFNIEKFIFISTDKAVNPTNVMGATKRFAEMYIQSIDIKDKTQFIITRFGNVLGSNGSVIPLFRKQIENGGPITVTHPDINRYFMTIPEACNLVLIASSMGRSNELFVFDMGDSVKIVDLAKKMIKLSGYEYEKDIKIIYTGLRPGEKLFEELLTQGENMKKTSNNKIMISKIQDVSKDLILNSINDLKKNIFKSSNEKIVSILKNAIPEYKSKNSDYEKLDS